MLDPATIQKLVSGKMDLPGVAGAFGLHQRAVKPEEMIEVLTRSAELAVQSTGAPDSSVEVLLITGSPAILKGRKVHILAVLGDFHEDEPPPQLSA